METGKNQLTTSSTFATDLFGSNDTSSPSAVFGSIFSPSTSKKQDTQGGIFTSIFDSEKEKVQQQQQQQQPCHLSSSIYYGGQDVYSDPPLTYKKDGDEDDPHSASRGNWWQGSLYY